MKREEKGGDPDSTRGIPGDAAPALVWESDDGSESLNRPAPEDVVSPDTEQESAPAKGLSLYHHRRKMQAFRLLAAIVAIGGLLAVFNWRHFFESSISPPPVVEQIDPNVLFGQACAEMREAQGDTLHITDYRVEDGMLDQIADLDQLTTLILDKGVVSDRAIETIANLPNLQHLRLRLSPIGDPGMKRLAAVETLWYLNLPHAECTSRGVAELAALPRLRQLRLGSSKLNSDVTREIAKITSLRGIHLIGVPVTDDGLKHLASMKHLESLYLDDSAVTDAGWTWLFEEYPHLHVHVDQYHHDRDPKAHRHH